MYERAYTHISNESRDESENACEKIRNARELTACKMRRNESSCQCVAGEAHLIRAGVSGAREPVHGEHLVRTRAASVRVQHSQRVHGASVA